MQHEDHQYGGEVGADGQHSGGPFFIDVSPTMRIEDLRLTIQASPSLTTLLTVLKADSSLVYVHDSLY